MEDKSYCVSLTAEGFYWLWEDINLALQSTQKEIIYQDEFGKLHDLTDYETAELLEELEMAFEKTEGIQK